MREFSIIIPAYNAEHTISQAIDSIIDKPLFSHINIIVVDDASTDNTTAICERYCAKYTNISLLKAKQNKGVSATRNKGIELLKLNNNCCYFTFLDADDLWEFNLEYDYLVELISESEPSMIACNYYKQSEGGVKRR